MEKKQENRWSNKRKWAEIHIFCKDFQNVLRRRTVIARNARDDLQACHVLGHPPDRVRTMTHRAGGGHTYTPLDDLTMGHTSWGGRTQPLRERHQDMLLLAAIRWILSRKWLIWLEGSPNFVWTHCMEIRRALKKRSRRGSSSTPKLLRWIVIAKWTNWRFWFWFDTGWDNGQRVGGGQT